MANVAGLRIDVFVTADGSHIEIAAGKADHEVCGPRHFDGGFEVVVRRVLNGEHCVRAVNSKGGSRVAAIPGERDTNTDGGDRRTEGPPQKFASQQRVY